MTEAAMPEALTRAGSVAVDPVGVGSPHFDPVAAGMVPVPAYLVAQPDRLSGFALRMWARSPSWGAPLAILACFATGVAYTLFTHPTTAGADSTPNCLVKLTTGFDCPGCGGTRAFWYLLHGNLAGAARSHLLAVFAAPYLVYMYIAWATDLMFRWKLPMLKITPKTIATFLAVWAVFTVVRNLPWAPFTWLYV